MRLLNKAVRMMTALAALTALGCGGGGGGGGAAVIATTPTSMKQVTPPANAGTVGGFVYASTQSVPVDIAVPAANIIVTIYDKRPANSVYTTAGVPSTAPSTASAPVQLARGMSSATLDPTDNLYHYQSTITVPTAATSVYVTANATAVVAITSGKVAAKFDLGGII